MSSKTQEPRTPEAVPLIELYKIVWQTRNFEIKLFWQRSNYFLVLNTALSLGFFVLPSDLDGRVYYAVALSVLGFFVSFLWLRINAGSKFWQSCWEYRLSKLESCLSHESVELFAAGRDAIRHDAKMGLEYGTHSGLRRAWDSLVMKRHSVSSQMALLSFAFIIAWTALLLVTSGLGIAEFVAN